MLDIFICNGFKSDEREGRKHARTDIVHQGTDKQAEGKAMQSNLSRSKPPVPMRTDPGAHSNPESARQVSEGEDFTHSRQLIESLMEDNRLLQEEIDDYRRVASILHTRCLDLQVLVT